MHLHVLHRTHHVYATPVRDSFNEARLQPLTADGQVCLDYQLSTDPPSRMTHFIDFHQNHVHQFEITTAHSVLTVESRATVSTTTRHLAPGQTSTPLAAMGGCAQLAQCFEFLQPSHYTAPIPEARVLGQEITAGTPDAWHAAQAITAYIHRNFAYKTAATTVHTHMREVLRNRQGVCQDFAHVMLGICRALGIPARYVSGYLYNGPADTLRGAQASHAWVEIYLPDHGWRGLDPTNNTQPDERYMKIATGRDYADVSPIKGTYRGTGDRRMSVEVLVTALEPAGC